MISPGDEVEIISIATPSLERLLSSRGEVRAILTLGPKRSTLRLALTSGPLVGKDLTITGTFRKIPRQRGETCRCPLWPFPHRRTKTCPAEHTPSPT